MLEFWNIDNSLELSRLRYSYPEQIVLLFKFKNFNLLGWIIKSIKVSLQFKSIYIYIYLSGFDVCLPDLIQTLIQRLVFLEIRNDFFSNRECPLYRSFLKKLNQLLTCFLCTSFSCLISWPNGLASRHKLKTWACLRLCLARPCVCLR